MQTAAEIISDRFETISARCGPSGRPTALPRNEQTIWYVVATRCDIDMGGFASVLDQLLTESELLFLVEVLAELGEPELSSAFQRTHVVLAHAGFYRGPSRMYQDLDPSVQARLETIATSIEVNAGLWGLDDRLAQLPIDTAST